MTRLLKYKGHKAVCEWDNETKMFHGRIEYPYITITFLSKTEKGLMPAMIDAIDDYLEHYYVLEGDK